MADNRARQQSQRAQNKKKNSSKKGLLGWLVFLVAAMLANTSKSSLYNFQWRIQRLFRSFRLTDPVALVLAGTVAAVLLIAVIAGVLRKKVGEGASPARARRDGRVSAAAQRSDPRARSFTPPEPYCVVCDHSSEDHFQRDKTQRIRQLDEWLKNGLIDREEYRVLKARYERDI